MKKYILFLVTCAAIFGLSSCSPTPEEKYIEALNTQMPKMEEIGKLMENIGDQMEKGQFSDVNKNLIILKEKADSFGHVAYTGEDTSLKTVSGEFSTALEKISEFSNTLQPLAEKALVNENAPMTADDEAAQKKSLELMGEVESHFNNAGKAFDEYTAKNQ